MVDGIVASEDGRLYTVAGNIEVYANHDGSTNPGANDDGTIQMETPVDKSLPPPFPLRIRLCLPS